MCVATSSIPVYINKSNLLFQGAGKHFNRFFLFCFLSHEFIYGYSIVNISPTSVTLRWERSDSCIKSTRKINSRLGCFLI